MMRQFGQDRFGSLQQEVTEATTVIPHPVVEFNLLPHPTHPLLLWKPFSLAQQGHSSYVNAEKAPLGAVRSLMSVALRALSSVGYLSTIKYITDPSLRMLTPTVK